MKIYNIESQKYVTPDKKSNLVFIVVNIAVFIVSLSSIISLIADGFSIKSIGTIAVCIYISFKLKKIVKIKPYYEYAIAKVTLDNNIYIEYDDKKVIEVFTNSIKCIEYSDQLECIRFICEYKIYEKKDTEYKTGEFLLYINYENYSDLFFELEKLINKKIVFVDRSL